MYGFISTKTLYAYIGSGENNRMYTLRFMDEGYRGEDPSKSLIEVSFYVSNLSIDYDTAVKKAKQKLAESYPNIKFKDNSEFELESISRKAVDHQAAALREIELADKARAQEEQIANFVKAGVIQRGKYNDVHIDDLAKIDVDYINWLSTNDHPHDIAVKSNNLIALNWLKSNPQPISDFVGTIGSVINFELKFVTRIPVESLYGTTWMIKCVDQDGNIIIFYSTANWALSLNLADDVKLKATVKYHKEYNGIKSTTLTKIKVIK